MQWRCFLAAILITVGGCASVRTYDMKKLERDFGQTVQTSEAIVQKSQSDYREKSTLVESLKKGGDPGFKEVEDKLRRHLGMMALSLDKMNARHKTMREANGRLASLGYARPEVQSGDPQYDKVTEAVTDFQHAAKDVNAAVLDYSRESNSLADEVSKRRLFFNFDIADFQKRVQNAIRASQTNLTAMNKDVQRSQGVVLNWNRKESRKSHEDLLQAMVSGSQEYAQKAKGLSAASREMSDATDGVAKISTMDPRWKDAQKASEAFEQTVLELKRIATKFQNDLELFRRPARPAP
ncbi:MAG: hypothetical protein KF799_05950 [Bdellovibrionales bacterium]|nr:hypothetical protein [Bdellovibrionales bacterium]